MNYKNIKQELNRLAAKYQKGGYAGEADKMAKERFNSAVNWEKEYLKGKKIKERILKLGLDPEAELERIGDRVNNVTLNVDNSDSNMNGAYYSDRDNSINYNQNDSRSMGSYAMNHESGHMFDRSNIRNSDMIDDRNGFVDPSFTGGLWQKIKSALSSEYNAREGHEANWGEMVADVHAARQELKKSGYDGRFSNFTNQAYNDMRRYADKKPDSASGRLFMKVGAPETSRYNILKMQYNQINPNEIPKEDKDFIKNYEQNKKKYDDIQKRYMFDIMNKVVSNEEPNRNIDFVKLGGLIKLLKV